MKIIIEGTSEEIREFFKDPQIVAVPYPAYIPAYEPWQDNQIEISYPPYTETISKSF